MYDDKQKIRKIYIDVVQMFDGFHSHWMLRVFQ